VRTVRSGLGGWSSVDEVPPSALIEVGCVGAVFDHFEVRLLPECPAGRDCSGKELTADATIAPARRARRDWIFEPVA